MSGILPTSAGSSSVERSDKEESAQPMIVPPISTIEVVSQSVRTLAEAHGIAVINNASSQTVTKTDKVVTSQLEGEIKHAAADTLRSTKNAVIGEIAQRRQRLEEQRLQEEANPVLKGKAQLKSINKDMGIVQARVSAAAEKTPALYTLYIYKESQNPVAKLAIASYPPLTAIKQELATGKYEDIKHLISFDNYALYKKEEALEILHLLLASIAVIPILDELTELEKTAIQNSTLLREDGTKITELTEKVQHIRLKQIMFIESLDTYLQRISKIPGPYIPAKLIKQFFQEGKEHYKKALTTYSLVKGELKLIEVEKLVIPRLDRLTTYVSSAEILSSSPQDHDRLFEVISASLILAAKLVPLSKVEENFQFASDDAQGVKLAAATHYYNKDQILKELKNASVFDPSLQAVLEQVSKLQDFYISSKTLSEMLTKKMGDDLKAHLTVYVLPEDLLNLTTNVAFRKEIESAIAKVQAQQVYPAAFAFKIGLENQRELLLGKLLESMGAPRQFVVPKIGFEMSKASFDGKKGPKGIASQWIGGSPFDKKAWLRYHDARRRVAFNNNYEKLLAKKSEIEAHYKSAKGSGNFSKTIRYEDQLGFINQLKLSKEKMQADEKELKEAEAVLISDPRSQKSISWLGFFDAIFGSTDCDKRQIIEDANGNYCNIDFARFGLPFFVYESSGEVYATLRSFCLDHPYANIDMPKEMITVILSWNPDAIEQEWRAKGYIGDEEFYIRHNIFGELDEMRERIERGSTSVGIIQSVKSEKEARGYVAKLQDQLKGIKEAKDIKALREISGEHIDDGADFEKVRVEKIEKFRLMIAKGEIPTKLMEDAKKFFINKFEEVMSIVKTTNDIGYLQVMVRGVTITKDNIEAVRSEIIKVLKPQIKIIENADSFDDLCKFNRGFLIEFLKAIGEKEQEECFSKTSEIATKQIIDRLKQFQAYLKSKPEGATLREGVEQIYPYLAPFWRAVRLLSGQEFENSSVEADAYRSLEGIKREVKDKDKYFLDSELQTIDQTYANLKNGGFKGVTIGKASDNGIAV